MRKEIQWLLKEKYRGRPNIKFKKDIERLKAGEPLDYVIGFTEFLGCKINLSKNPLIPRTETEYWVQKTIENSSLNFNGRRNQETKFLDIFAGSGCIGVTILKHIKNSNVIFIEKDKKFLEQIEINCRINKIPPNRYKIIQSDIFNNSSLYKRSLSQEHSFFKGGNRKFDYIFANPPYIAKNRKIKIQKSVLKYEPRMALFGGKDGLFYIKKFLAQAKNFLNPKGKVFMEFDRVQKKEIEKLLKKYGYKDWEFNKDQYKKWRWVCADN